MKKLTLVIAAPILLASAYAALASSAATLPPPSHACVLTVYDVQNLYSEWKSGPAPLSQDAHDQLKSEWWTVVNCKNDGFDPSSAQGQADAKHFQDNTGKDNPF
jgi:hypothetical protein